MPQQLSIKVPNTWVWDDVPISRIDVDDMAESAYRHTSGSIRALGIVFQNVVLLKRDDRYTVVAGKRRILGARQEGHEKVHAMVFSEGTPEAILATVTLVENAGRAPNPAAEAESLDTVMTAYAWTEREAAQHLCLPLTTVRSRLALFRLIPDFFARLRDGRITLSMAKRLVKLPRAKQEELLGDEDLTVEKLDGAVRERSLAALSLIPVPDLSAAAQKTADPVEALIRQAEDRITKAIAITTNGNRERFAKALRILKGDEE